MLLQRWSKLHSRCERLLRRAWRSRPRTPKASWRWRGRRPRCRLPLPEQIDTFPKRQDGSVHRSPAFLLLCKRGVLRLLSQPPLGDVVMRSDPVVASRDWTIGHGDHPPVRISTTNVTVFPAAIFPRRSLRYSAGSPSKFPVDFRMRMMSSSVQPGFNLLRRQAIHVDETVVADRPGARSSRTSRRLASCCSAPWTATSSFRQGGGPRTQRDEAHPEDCDRGACNGDCQRTRRKRKRRDDAHRIGHDLNRTHRREVM